MGEAETRGKSAPSSVSPIYRFSHSPLHRISASPCPPFTPSPCRSPRLLFPASPRLGVLVLIALGLPRSYILSLEENDSAWLPGRRSKKS